MGISRRGALTAFGAGMAGVTVGGCASAQGRAAAPQATSAPVRTAATSTAASTPDLGALATSLGARLVQPGARTYEAAHQLFNPLFDNRKPRAVAQIANESEVAACVRTAAAARLPIAARSGGHSYAGYSAPNGALVVDLARLAGVRVHPDGTAVIGAGARLGSVYSALAKAGRALPAGSCPTVGISGLTLGGGVGVLTRKYGLTCDRLRSLRIVTADGTVRTASAEREPDLFWALRGAGGGNLGIVTELTFDTVPAPRLTVLTMSFPPGSAAKVFDAWQRWLPGAPAEFWTKCTVTSAAEPAARIAGCFTGNAKAFAPLLAELRKRIGIAPKTVHTEEKDYGAAMRFFAGSSARETFHATSAVLTAPLDAARLTRLASGKPGVAVMFDALGGAVSAIGASETAFPHRTALATVQIYSGTDQARVRAVRDGLGLPGSYVNYIDPGQPNWAQAYYGGNAGRLRTIAAHYDPHRLFDFAQGLGRI
ncbi:FAD-binding oxidoreductase [Sciscionella marina]|uniref:FAD-binding oxidoreductase n=1 Tax=Sciscionella marina TaxID=508770 RepID=UPI000360D28F|nr:FAD-binding oxidoreductase [Sciscionella marina]